MWALFFAGLIGLVAGLLAGLFGVGGGILFVPTLTLVLGLTQIHAEASSLLAILPTAAAGAWRQRSYGNVRWRPALTLGLAATWLLSTSTVTRSVNRPFSIATIDAMIFVVLACGRRACPFRA